ncbi:MAG TPA: TetR/AcrR family transcriptional regulator [Amycolatopsis sp.]|uniref:TetR/AcrR family transcriptional regulator n=1 Tax=Amycolatopsis sp. TaxID=37632 RepID=UPI002F3F831E
MSASVPSRPVRADAERSVARILEAARVVLADDPTASMERIADEAGVGRATVHRRFASRKTLLETLCNQLDDQYLRALQEAKVDTAPPLVALYRVTERVMELKLGNRSVLDAVVSALPGRDSHLSAEVQERAEQLFARLHAAGAITAENPAWCLRLYLAIFDAVHHTPAGAPELAGAADDVTARTNLLVTTVLRALGGEPPAF